MTSPTLVVLLVLLGLATAFDWDVETPLDRYVNRPDPSYEYREIDRYEYDGVDCYVLNMTSQTWKNESWSNRPIWWHYEVILIPQNIRFKDTGMLFIEGGNMNDSPPDPDSDAFYQLVLEFVNRTGVVGGYLKQIPNQRIIFTDDPLQKNRAEDDMIAYTWRTYIEDYPGDPEVLARMPMTKAAVRALDTITSFTKSIDPSFDVHEFLVGGGSKRAWTAWTLACVDKRVVAVAPMVMSLLNFTENLHHHYRAYGGWSWPFKDYYNENVTQYLPDWRTEKLAEIVDPFAYKERLNMTKIVISATGDEFFLPDDTHYFWDDLPGENYLMLCENTQHTLITHHDRIVDNLIALTLSKKTGYELPTVSWTREETATNGTITATASLAPVAFSAWRAETDVDFTAGRRDFRFISDEEIQPILWEEYPAEDKGNNVFSVTFDKVEGEWVAFFLELNFNGAEGELFEITSELHVIPDTFPFARCTTPEECKGTLV